MRHPVPKLLQRLLGPLPASRSRRYSCDLPSSCRTESPLRFQHSLGDSLIGAAPTEIPAHAFTHALWIAVGLTLFNQTNRPHDLARGTEAALQAVVGKKRLLYGMKAVTLRDAFDRKNVSAVMTDRKRQTGIHPASVDEDSACAALAAVTALFGPRQFEPLTKKIQERDPRVIEFYRSLHAVHGHDY